MLLHLSMGDELGDATYIDHLNRERRFWELAVQLSYDDNLASKYRQKKTFENASYF